MQMILSLALLPSSMFALAALGSATGLPASRSVASPIPLFHVEKKTISTLVPAAAAAAAGRPAAVAGVRTERCPAAPVDHGTDQNAGCSMFRSNEGADQTRPDQTSIVEVFINAFNVTHQRRLVFGGTDNF